MKSAAEPDRVNTHTHTLFFALTFHTKSGIIKRGHTHTHFTRQRAGGSFPSAVPWTHAHLHNYTQFPPERTPSDWRAFICKLETRRLRMWGASRRCVIINANEWFLFSVSLSLQPPLTSNARLVIRSDPHTCMPLPLRVRSATRAQCSNHRKRTHDSPG